MSVNRRIGFWGRALAVALSCTLLGSNLPAQSAGSEYTFRSQTEIVLVNVTVRDKNGNFVRGLKPEDFTVLEDNKPQHVASFDIENTDALPSMDVAQTKLLGSGKLGSSSASVQSSPQLATEQFKDRRLLILFFDLTSMQPEEIDRAASAALNYVDKQMAPADLVSVISLGSSLTVNQDFTSDRQLLKQALNGFNAGGGQGFEEGTTGTTEGTSDNGQPFTADDTEYNIFNTDRRLEALRSLAASLSRVNQKKSLIYFSSGMDRTGIENESELRSAINAAVRSNLAIYTMDIRGLQAMVPGGEAQNASMRGTSPYSGKATLNQYNSNFSTQETLVTLAGDTGGRAFLDSNDFGKLFTQMQQDTQTYYVIGYHSTNPTRDGRFRRITVRLDQPGVKIEYRKGYYAPADFQHSNQEDRERQLEEELASDLPDTDLPVYLAAGYFRLSGQNFFVPVSVAVPGSAIPFTLNGDKDKATLDVIGVVLDEQKRPAGHIRDTVKLALNTSAQVRSKNVQYDNGFILTSGTYHLKFVLRENQSGQLGSFETDLTVPDFKTQPLKMSSVILASQLQPAAKHSNGNPLVRDGSEVIPSVSHVFSQGQHLYLHYEIYDPAREAETDKGKSSAKDAIRLLTNVSFFQGKAKVYETKLIEVDQVNEPDRHAAVFQLDVPLTELKPGFYVCQVNVIDDAAGRFLFPRMALLLRAPGAPQPK